MGMTLLTRLEARDRALFMRWAIDDSTAHVERVVLSLITHAGGVCSSIVLALLPVLGVHRLAAAGWCPFGALVISHLIVQAFKRTIGRPRPSRTLAHHAMVHEPDRFSFPSGHAAAAMSIAVVYAALFPAFAAPLILVAAAIGLTRVFLGVHYPGDVLAGQLIAAVVSLAMLAV